MPQTLAFGFMNTAWATGAMIGPARGGALAEAIGDPAPYVLCAGSRARDARFVSRPGRHCGRVTAVRSDDVPWLETARAPNRHRADADR